MGRAPCCDKANVKKGPWSPEEDAKLKSYIEQHGTGGNWIALPQKIELKRCGKSCRLRWLNYLRPNIKHGGFSEEEDRIICSLYVSIGSRWSIIAAQLPGRTDNDIKNYWNTRLKKKLWGKQRKDQQARRGSMSSLKQDIIMNRGSTTGNSINGVPYSNHPNPNYWPELPVITTTIPYSNQEPYNYYHNDHSSIRKLLIKLGGRFTNDDRLVHDGNNLQFPLSNHRQLFEQHDINTMPLISSTIDTSCIKNGVQFTDQNQYSMNNVEAGFSMVVEGQSGFTAEVGNNIVPQSLEGLEFLYGEEMVDHDRLETITSPKRDIEPIGWSEMSSLISTPDLYHSNYEGMVLQGMSTEECGGVSTR